MKKYKTFISYLLKRKYFKDTHLNLYCEVLDSFVHKGEVFILITLSSDKFLNKGYYCSSSNCPNINNCIKSPTKTCVRADIFRDELRDKIFIPVPKLKGSLLL